MPDDLELATDLVRAAGELAAQMLHEGLRVEHKTSVSDVVSAADRAAEELVGSRLRRERPDDAVVGEEGTDVSGRSGVRTWYIDPVDGTYNFLTGLPSWCSAVGLVQPDRDPLGAVYQQTAGELWVGGPGRPTTRNGRPVPRLVDRGIGELALATYLHPTSMPDDTLRIPLLRVLERSATVRMLGSGSIDLAAVAAGRLGASLQSNSAPWDWYPGAALVLAAGGSAEIVEAAGRRWHVAGNHRAVGEIADLLRSAMT